MKQLRAHPFALTLVAFALAGGTVAAVAAGYGFGAFATAWKHVHFAWLALVLVAAVLAVPAYVVAYMTVARVQDGPRLRVPLVVRVVIAGFGAFAPGGGFALDKRALEAIEDDGRAAAIRVLGLGAMEWALLAPAAWVSAVVLLADGDSRPMPSLLWPWAIAVPAGTALALWLAMPARRERIANGKGRLRRGVAQALEAIRILHSLATGAVTCWQAWFGMGVYWALEIASLYGATRFIGLRLGVGEAVLAYATGYALTRRSLPLGGAGVTEAFLTFSLHWVGQPVAPSLAAVVVYRVFNFVLPTFPALLVRSSVKPLLDAAEDGATPAHAERRRAARGFSFLWSETE
jgi:uncharacterized membrane protein YbhN (UPF0104 family)